MHTSGSPPVPDLIGFSPARSLINFEEDVVSPTRSLADQEERAGSEPLESLANKTTSPLLKLSSSGDTVLVRGDSNDVPLTTSSATVIPPSPLVHIPAHDEIIQPVIREPMAQLNKRVRFDLSALKKDSTPSDSGLEDILAPNATLRKNTRDIQSRNIAASEKGSPLLTMRRSKTSKPKPTRILDQFKRGHLGGDSDDEVQAPTQTHSQAGDRQATEATIDLAERAMASLVETAANDVVSGTRRSGRAPKPKDFGDVEVHGWKTKRARKS